jgi:hypothetical protein
MPIHIAPPPPPHRYSATGDLTNYDEEGSEPAPSPSDDDDYQSEDPRFEELSDEESFYSEHGYYYYYAGDVSNGGRLASNARRLKREDGAGAPKPDTKCTTRVFQQLSGETLDTCKTQCEATASCAAYAFHSAKGYCMGCAKDSEENPQGDFTMYYMPTRLQFRADREYDALITTAYACTI